jgi:hypothetical protein
MGEQSKSGFYWLVCLATKRRLNCLETKQLLLEATAGTRPSAVPALLSLSASNIGIMMLFSSSPVNPVPWSVKNPRNAPGLLQRQDYKKKISKYHQNADSSLILHSCVFPNADRSHGRLPVPVPVMPSNIVQLD